MLEVRLHGRGGQGAVTSAELVAEAAINEGKYAQAFPSFGPERRGAPVRAFIRVDNGPIPLRNEIDEPDVVLVLDPTLIRVVNVTEGLKKDGIVVLNTSKIRCRDQKRVRHHGKRRNSQCHQNRNRKSRPPHCQYHHAGRPAKGDAMSLPSNRSRKHSGTGSANWGRKITSHARRLLARR